MTPLDPVLRSLAEGPGDPTAFAWLTAVQRRLRILQLGALEQDMPHPAFAAVKHAEAVDPARAAAALHRPYVGVWAAETLQALATPDGPPPDTAYLDALAARCRESRESRDSRDSRGDDIRLAFGTHDIVLDDRDPYRDRFHWPAADPLGDHEVTCWAKTLAEAWQVCQTRFPRYAAGVDTLLTTVTPLRPRPGSGASAACRRAFGAVGIAYTSDPEALAVLLVHEIQHVKLGALLDAVPLYRPGGAARHRSPWRDDLRPAAALLQGVYAHTAVAYCVRDDPQKLRQVTRQLRQAVGTLEESGELTPLGEVFLARMRGSSAGYTQMT